MIFVIVRPSLRLTSVPVYDRDNFDIRFHVWYISFQGQGLTNTLSLHRDPGPTCLVEMSETLESFISTRFSALNLEVPEDDVSPRVVVQVAYAQLMFTVLWTWR